MVADITDTDYAYTGQKREAMFFGVQGLFTKAMIGFSSWFTLSVMFAKFGYSIGNELGIRLAGPIAGIAALLGAVFLKGYKLD
jgi:GPH family glycoside/pentoside/hexuronide:cation symporter